MHNAWRVRTRSELAAGLDLFAEEHSESYSVNGAGEIMSGGADGIGSITWWGFSSAVDLAALAPRPGESAEDEEGAGLGRSARGWSDICPWASQLA